MHRLFRVICMQYILCIWSVTRLQTELNISTFYQRDSICQQTFKTTDEKTVSYLISKLIWKRKRFAMRKSTQPQPNFLPIKMGIRKKEHHPNTIVLYCFYTLLFHNCLKCHITHTSYKHSNYQWNLSNTSNIKQL